MSKVHEAARRAIRSFYGLTVKLKKLTLDEVIRKYPQGVTITGFDMIDWNGTKYPRCTFAEEPNACFSDTGVLKEIFDEVLCAYGGDIEAANVDLRKEPLRMRLFWKKTLAVELDDKKPQSKQQPKPPVDKTKEDREALARATMELDEKVPWF